MDRQKTASLTTARQFFAEELKAVMSRHSVSTQPEAFNYLVGLLVRTIQADNFFNKTAEGKLEDNFLVELYSEYMQAGPEQKSAILQKIGDICLMISGFFAESISRKVVDLDYYFGMGGTAYHTLSQMQTARPNQLMYVELSKKFQPFSNVLGEMSERSGLQSNKDLLRLYERWLLTGSDRLRSILSEHGIAALKVDKNRH